jgi:hypothetical protein
MFVQSKDDLAGKIDSVLNHVSLMRGKYPFSSILLILRKKSSNIDRKKIEFINYNSSDNFLKEGIKRLEEKLQNSSISLNPFSSLPDGISPYCIDHQEYFSKDLVNQENSDTIFHTDYFWFGNHSRNFCIDIEISDELSLDNGVINLRVHRYPVLNSAKVACIFEKDVKLDSVSGLNEYIKIELDEDYVYAFLAKMKSGNVIAKKISISSKPSDQENNLNYKSIKVLTTNLLNKIC